MNIALYTSFLTAIGLFPYSIMRSLYPLYIHIIVMIFLLLYLMFYIYTIKNGEIKISKSYI